MRRNINIDCMSPHVGVKDGEANDVENFYLHLPPLQILDDATHDLIFLGEYAGVARSSL